VHKGRLEAFSDGVIAIIITIMVLELRPPHDSDVHALWPVLPAFLSYVMSFVYVGIYWSNHHHLLQAAEVVNGKILWANLHLLFWLSLIPFGTAWLGESGGSWPTALYGVILFMAGVAYRILERALITHHGEQSTLAVAVGRDAKATASVLGCVVAVALAFVQPLISSALYVGIALVWLVPDRRIETAVKR
jgi:TMEM175 potassium channel family protein